MQGGKPPRLWGGFRHDKGGQTATGSYPSMLANTLPRLTFQAANGNNTVTSQLPK